MPRRARRPDPPPLETNDTVVVLLGTGLWTAGLVVLLVMKAADLAPVRGWWLGMCCYGIALGLCGLYIVRRRHSAIARDAVRGVPRQS